MHGRGGGAPGGSLRGWGSASRGESVMESALTLRAQPGGCILTWLLPSGLLEGRVHGSGGREGGREEGPSALFP